MVLRLAGVLITYGLSPVHERTVLVNAWQIPQLLENANQLTSQQIAGV